MAVDVTKLLQKAHQAIERRNYGLAIMSYSQALTFQPENIDARTKLRATQNRAFAESGVSPAIAMLKSLIPFLKAKILFMRKKYEEALLAAEETLTANPGNVRAMRLVASAAMEKGWYELATWQMREILSKHDPENVDIMYELIDTLQEIGEVNEAIELCEKIKKLSPDEDVGGLIRGLAAEQTAETYRKGAEEGAHAIVKNEEERQKLEADTHVARDDATRLSQIQGLRNRFDERADYKLLLRIADLWYNLDDFGRGYEEGIKTIDEAKSLMPSDHNISAKKGDFEIKRLRLAAREAQKTHTESGGTDGAIKQAYQQALKELRTFQIQEYEQRVRNQPLITDYHHQLGKLYLELKQYDKAVAEFQQSCKDPKWAVEALTCMGQSFVGMDNLDLGIDMYKRAMDGQEVFSKIKDTVYFMGQAMEHAGDLKAALAQYTRIYEDDIMYKDIKERVAALRQKIKDTPAGS